MSNSNTNFIVEIDDDVDADYNDIINELNQSWEREKDEFIKTYLKVHDTIRVRMEDVTPKEEYQTNPNKYNNETKIKLTQLLDSSRSNKVHTEIIMKLPTLKDAHMYCKYNNLSGQFTGPVLEKYIKIIYKMTKNNASSCNGDLKWNEINIEIKASNGGKENNKFNFVQLRMNHNCEYILTAYYLDYTNLENLGELYIFKLNKENIKPIIVKYGGYAHGTIGELGKITFEDLNDTNNPKEYAIRPKYGDKCWIELLNFRIDEIII